MESTCQEYLIGFCPQCNRESRSALHNGKVAVHKRIAIKPILPTCLECGGAVRVHTAAAPAPGRRVVLLTGTCASGKSTTAETLVAQHGFHGIDGNCVLAVIRHTLKTTPVFNGPEVLQEIAAEMDMLLSLQRDIVISHVVVPEDLPAYREIFRQRQVDYRVVVLRPQYQAAVARSKARTCFKSTTPEAVVRLFHDAMLAFEPAKDVIVLDNSASTANESAERVVRLFDAKLS